MRRRLAGGLCALGVCVAVCAAITAGSLLAQENGLLEQLSVRESDAQRSFFDAIWDGSPYIPGGQTVFKGATTDAKVAIVRGLATLLKAYTKSNAFKARYAEYLDANRPRPDRERVKSVAEQDAETARAIQDMEANIKNMPPDVRKQMEETVKQMKAQQESLKKNTQYQAMMESSVKQARAGQDRQYQERLSKFNAEHPTDPDILIASRLRQFLTVSSDVNYQAALVKQGDLLRFQDPALEQKPAEWKLCFRAGREAAETARAFATEWLQELTASTQEKSR